MYLCVRVIDFACTKPGELGSCICVLELLILPVPSQESERSCICVRVIDFACTKPGE